MEENYLRVIKEAYLKCRYYPEYFSEGYSIDFKVSESPNPVIKRVLINGEKLFREPEERGSGLVQVLIGYEGEKSSKVIIYGLREDVGKFFIVPNEELVFDEPPNPEISDK
ncbi:MAG: hypothetical protein Q8Q04_03310 [archaeon]|nr:hypothetical protein [archaeon]